MSKPDPSKMKMCVVNIMVNDALTSESEHTMYFVEHKSLSLINECLQGLEKLGKARQTSLKEIEAMGQIGTLLGGV